MSVEEDHTRLKEKLIQQMSEEIVREEKVLL